MEPDTTTVAIFVDDVDGVVGVGFVLHDPSIVELGEEELVAGCKFTPEQARSLMYGLQACLAQIGEA